MVYETAIVGGMVGILFLIAYLAFNLQDRTSSGAVNEDENIPFMPLKLLLILMVFLGIAVTLFIMNLIAVENLQSVANLVESTYIAYLTVFSFVVGYFILMFVAFAFGKLNVKTPK